MTKEKLIEQIMSDFEKDGTPVTKEEAEEIAEMELKNATNRHYEKADKPRKSVKRERKIDSTKQKLISCFKVLLEGMKTEILNVKTETEINFVYEDEEYTLKLIKHRKGK